jgi:LmbE family N-acetylglucosaminyl deacetylase
LVVAPHPDDETLGCGGTLIAHRQAGDRVLVLQVTDGRASRAGGLSPDAMAARRRAEARKAMSRLQVELESLDLPEGAWQPSELETHLAAILAHTSPTIVYAPSPIDYHPEHVRVAGALAQALATAPEASRVRIYELGVPLGADLTNLVVDTTAVESARQAALAAYETQSRGFSGLRRLRRYAGEFWLGRGFAEPFWELSPAAYRAVVDSADADLSLAGRRPVVQTADVALNSAPSGVDQTAQPARTAFRGLRPRAFGDPLSYLVGRAARRRLARAAAKAELGS